MKYIIIDLNTKKALYGLNSKTLEFTNLEAAIELANQFFQKGDFIVVSINLK